MNDLHEIRKGALLALCQFDAGRQDELDAVRDGLLAGDLPDHLADAAMQLAADVWSDRTAIDEATSSLTTAWPVHRQPIVDRALLRLAAFEIRTGRVPGKVAIDEAVELAREFSTAESPKFINGVLDRLWHDCGAESS